MFKRSRYKDREKRSGIGIQPRIIVNTVPRIAAAASEATIEGGEEKEKIKRKGSMPIDVAYRVLTVAEHVAKGLMDGSFAKRVAYLASIGLLRVAEIKNEIAYFVDLEVRREDRTLQVPIRVATKVGKRVIAEEVGILMTVATVIRKAFEALENEVSEVATVVRKSTIEEEASEEEAQEAVQELAQGFEGDFAGEEEGDDDGFEAKFKLE